MPNYLKAGLISDSESLALCNAATHRVYILVLYMQIN